MAAVGEARPAYEALGGELDTFIGVWHHGWVLPTRQQIYGYFCKALGATQVRVSSQIMIVRVCVCVCVCARYVAHMVMQPAFCFCVAVMIRENWLALKINSLGNYNISS